jgi:F0F1-type ATP synthase membrane subunit a
METCSDIYQPFRMAFVWPVIVGCVAFYGVRFIASALDGKLTRWQAILAGIVGLMAAVVSTTISRNWTGSDAYWLAFTIGLAFAAGVLLANVIMSILEAGRDG